MNLVLLSGGSGQRLWPLSNDIRSKQFIKIFHREDGELESMVQRVYRQIKAVDTDATVTIATSKSQVSAIHNQLGEEVGISVEPCRRDTSPAIALAAAYLKDVQGVGEEESVVVCPVDPYVENDYFEALKALGDRAAVSSANLVLMGIEPTYPSEKYGYIIPIGKEQVSKVSVFKEKPTQEVAKDYIAKGALWNGGVFAFKLGYVLNRAHELIDFVDYEDLFNKYDTLNKISFDYAVVEHEPEIEVMRFTGTWKDLGTWNTLTGAMDGHVVGEAMLNEKCENVHVVNELDVPILCMGLKDVVVSASPEGILVSDKEQSSYIKPFVNMLDHRVMFAEKSWGSFKVIDIDKESMTIKVTLNAGHRMNYHSHQHRDEVWTVIAGKGKTIVDGMEQNVKAGDVITMSAGCRHTVIAETELKLIEVQLGKEIDVNDKQKFELEYWGAVGGVYAKQEQENSNLTYRLYDYDRVGKDGKKRELHIDKALDVANLKSSAEPRQPLRVLKYRQGVASELLTRCKYFEVYRMIVNTERRQKVHYRADGIAFRVLLCVNGCGTISYDGGSITFYKGDCIFVPADSEILTLHGQAQFLDVRG